MSITPQEEFLIISPAERPRSRARACERTVRRDVLPRLHPFQIPIPIVIVIVSPGCLAPPITIRITMTARFRLADYDAVRSSPFQFSPAERRA